MQRLLLIGAVIGAFVSTTSHAADSQNMIGRQSHNIGMSVLPALGPVTIDGNLDDWDLSGQIWSFADVSVRDRFSVKSATMWDDKFLYLCCLWKDPMPLNSTIDPLFNPSKGWIADAVQLRILADKQPLWVTTWFFAERKEAVCHFSYWKNPTRDKDGQEELLMRSKPGDAELGHGVALAYKALPEADGFIQEMRIPWKMVYKRPHTPAAGQVFRMGMEFLWGDPTGRTWPVHRYADNLYEPARRRFGFDQAIRQPGGFGRSRHDCAG